MPPMPLRPLIPPVMWILSDAQIGKASFKVTNNGSKINEFYVLTEAGRVEGEVENIGPGASRTLQVHLSEPGDYKVQCKPDMVGEGISHGFSVSGESQDATRGDESLQEAVDNYLAYVKNQVKNLDEQTDAFVKAVDAGDMDKAKALFAQARTPYERIEPVAESFPDDLDPRIDAREADVEDEEKWTGFHVIERDLWGTKGHPAKITNSTKKAVEQLAKDVKELVEGRSTKDYSVFPCPGCWRCPRSARRDRYQQDHW